MSARSLRERLLLHHRVQSGRGLPHSKTFGNPGIAGIALAFWSAVVRYRFRS